MKNLIFILLLVTSFGSNADALKDYRDRFENATPDSVLTWLKAGNVRFQKGRSRHGGYSGDFRERIKVSAQGQRPIASILSCIDSRTTPDLVFDTAPGDIFTARVGGNVINDDVLGSLEIAAASGSKMIVIMGHTDCGGVKAACNNLELEHFTQLAEKIKPAILKANADLDADPTLSRAIGSRTTNNRRYVAHVSQANSMQSAQQIMERSETIREMVKKGDIWLFSAIYDVDSGKVTFLKQM